MPFSIAQTQQQAEASPKGPLQSPGLGSLALAKGFYFGSAIDISYTKNLDYTKYVFNEISCATPENSMHPNSMQQGGVGNFNFTQCDQELALCQSLGIAFRGHYLVNGRTTEPSFLSSAVTSPATALSVLTTQINGIMAHYKGKFKWVNVVNESIAFGGDSNGFQTGSVFYQQLGTDPSTGYIAQALKLAKAADPNVKVGLNFSGVDNSSAPNAEAQIRAEVLAYAKRLIAAGTPLDFIGCETHLGPNQGSGFSATDSTVWFAALANLGLKLHVTEMDRDDLTTGTLSARDSAIATDINAIVQAYLANPAFEVLQCWELSDRDSWLNRGFGQARSDNLSKRPTLLSWSYGPKTAYTDVRNAISAQRPPSLPASDVILTFGTVPTIVNAPFVITSSKVGTPTFSIQNSGGGGGGGGGTFSPNLPPGMNIVMQTGAMSNAVSTVSGGTWSTGGPVPRIVTNLSPNTISTVGEWSQNVQNPATGTGIQINYPNTTHGGNSPVRLQYQNFATPGTGTLYFAVLVTLSPGWSFSQATGVKMFDTHSVNSGNNDIQALNCQDDSGNKDGISAYPIYLLQGAHTGDIPGAFQGFPGPNSLFGVNEALANFGGPSRGTAKLLECLMTPESPTNTGNNGQLTYWVNGTKVFSTIGLPVPNCTTGPTNGIPCSGIAYNSGGSHDFEHDPTYGGDADADRPPASPACYVIYDQWTVATL